VLLLLLLLLLPLLLLLLLPPPLLPPLLLLLALSGGCAELDCMAGCRVHVAQLAAPTDSGDAAALDFHAAKLKAVQLTEQYSAAAKRRAAKTSL
jgi:hypothetical protein